MDELTGRMPSPAEAQQLGLSVGLPVVCILRTIYDDTGMPLELQETVAAADRHEFRYEVNLR
ncbi:MAG: UTRA domain-containing protein [Pseudonocardiales bacterium]|nr:UTRA domain-containing protein [Pseudonocardiales bacterium]